MKLEEFKIGEFFKCGDKLWLTTDIGTRVVVAIEAKAGWVNGPPYALNETVFDEDDQTACKPY